METIKNEKQRMTIEYSIPRWIIEHWITHYGIETTHKIAKSFLVQSASTVRVNTSRTDVETISKELYTRRLSCGYRSTHSILFTPYR